MEESYKNYILKSMDKVAEVVSAYKISDFEVQNILSELSDELIDNICNTNNLTDYELLIFKSLISSIDKHITNILSDYNADSQDNDLAVSLCHSQEQLIKIFNDKSWTLPQLCNLDISFCEKKLNEKQAHYSICQRIIDEDNKVSLLILKAKKELRSELCNNILDIINDLKNDIEICTQEQIQIPLIKNKRIDNVENQVIEMRKKSIDREEIYNKICEDDIKISKLIENQFDNLQELILLCQNQIDHISKCNENKWKTPKIKTDYLQEILDKCTIYKQMIDLDNKITNEKTSINTEEQYNNFCNDCSTQENNIEICKKNNWIIPDLTNTDLHKITDSVHIGIKHKEVIKKLKRILLYFVIALVVILMLILLGIYIYRIGKVKIPFNYSYTIGKNVDDIIAELENAGFENIVKKSDESGWSNSNEVTGVAIDGVYNYKEGKYIDSDKIIIVKYSSENRVNVTDIIKDWKNSDVDKLKNKLEQNGFTNITCYDVQTTDRDNDKLVVSLDINGNKYLDGECYLPSDAPIVITYNVFKVCIDNTNTQFIGQNYQNVVKNLKAKGFTDVRTLKINKGWSKGNTVLNVTINDSSTYSGNDYFLPNCKIVVEYSSDDRINATELFQNWENKNYEAFLKSLTDKGFNKIKVEENITGEILKNNLVSGVTINGDTFSQGDCYIQKSASIVIYYYRLKLALGDIENMIDDNYIDVKSKLLERGFTNIQFQRTDDLITGWINEDGSVKDITINGKKASEIGGNDSFYYDDQIIIVVYTKKRKEYNGL